MAYFSNAGWTDSTSIGDFYKGDGRAELLARMVASGRINLFDFQSSFKLELGMGTATAYVSESQKAITSPYWNLKWIGTESEYSSD